MLRAIAFGLVGYLISDVIIRVARGVPGRRGSGASVRAHWDRPRRAHAPNNAKPEPVKSQASFLFAM